MRPLIDIRGSLDDRLGDIMPALLPCIGLNNELYRFVILIEVELT